MSTTIIHKSLNIVVDCTTVILYLVNLETTRSDLAIIIKFPFDFIILLIRVPQNCNRNIVGQNSLTVSVQSLNMKSFTWPTFLLILFYFQFNGSSASEVITYYLKSYFRGPSTSIRTERGICYSLIDSYNNNRMSSIDPGKNCMDLYMGANCRGTSIRVSPGSVCKRDLSNCQMDNVVSSFKLC